MAECNYYCPSQDAEGSPGSLAKYLERAREENEDMRKFLDDLSEIFADKSKEMGGGEAVLRLRKVLEVGVREEKPTALKGRYILTEESAERGRDGCGGHRVNKSGEDTIGDKEMILLEDTVADSVAEKPVDDAKEADSLVPKKAVADEMSS